jgi:hypothetical protein
MIAVPTACGFGSPPATPTCGKMQGLALLVQEVSIRSGPRRSRCLRAVYARHRALHNEIRPVKEKRMKARAKLGRALANVECCRSRARPNSPASQGDRGRAFFSP